MYCLLGRIIFVLHIFSTDEITWRVAIGNTKYREFLERKGQNIDFDESEHVNRLTDHSERAGGNDPLTNTFTFNKFFHLILIGFSFRYTTTA